MTDLSIEESKKIIATELKKFILGKLNLPLELSLVKIRLSPIIDQCIGEIIKDVDVQALALTLACDYENDLAKLKALLAGLGGDNPLEEIVKPAIRKIFAANPLLKAMLGMYRGFDLEKSLSELKLS